MPDAVITRYWEAFQASLPEGSPYRGRKFIAEGFGDNPALADELGHLIATGTKTATCSALWEWEADKEPIIRAGDLTIVLDGQDQPLCIIETTEITIQSFNAVDDQFAWEEGEDDRTLKSWREAHWRYFTRTLAPLGKQPAPDMPLVCERFRVVYPPASDLGAERL